METLELTPGNPAFPEKVWNLFHDGHDPRQLDTVGGAVKIVAFPQQDETVVVATAGLSRVPVHEGRPAEFWVRTTQDAVGAAVVCLTVLVTEIAEHPQRQMWQPGKIWINAEPLLLDTLIQALVVPAVDTPDEQVTDGDGQVLGHVRELWMLTKHEARSIALDGPHPFLEALAANEGSLLDVERDDLVRSETIPDVPCLVTALARQQPARRVECDELGRFAAYTMEEEPASLADPDGYEFLTLPQLVELNGPEVREFIIDADPGEFLEYDEGEGEWYRGFEFDDEDDDESGAADTVSV